MLAATQRRRDGRQRDQKAGPEIGVQAIDQADDAAQAHLLFDVEVDAVEAVGAEEVAEGEVVLFEGGGVVVVGVVEAVEGAGGGAAEHDEDADAGELEGVDFFPEAGVDGGGGGVVVEGDVAGRVVEV